MILSALLAALIFAAALPNANGQYSLPGNTTMPDPRRIPMASPADCMPEKRTIKLSNDDNPSLLYFPSCTRVERCGGCCSQPLLSCQPTVVETQTFHVVVKKYVPGFGYQQKGIELIDIERHVKCKCDCRVKQSDCNRFQDYRPKECQCVCTNYDERAKCLSDDSRLKKWDVSKCSCECIRTKECSSGYFFNRHTCSCQVLYRILPSDREED